MKFLILLLAMVGLMSAGAWNSYQKRNYLIQAAFFSEGFALSKSVKSGVTDYYIQHNTMPHDNAEAGLPPAKGIFGTSVKRVAVNRSGVVMVDFQDEIGQQSMVFTPSVSATSNLIEWDCTSDSIDPKILKFLKPSCQHTPSTVGGQLMHAIANAHNDEVLSLLNSGANPDDVVSGNTPLMLAAKTGNTSAIKYLLESGASINNDILNSERRTPLMVAISSNNADAASMLLSNGASVKHRDYKGLTAKDYAITTDKRLGGSRYELMVSAKLNPLFAGNKLGLLTDTNSQSGGGNEVDSLYVDLVKLTLECDVKKITDLLIEKNDFKSGEKYLGESLFSIKAKPDCEEQLLAFVKTKKTYQDALESRFADATLACDKTKIVNMLSRNTELDVMARIGRYSPFEQSLYSGCTDVVTYYFREGKLKKKVDSSLLYKTIEKAPRDEQVVLVGQLIKAGINVNYADMKGNAPLAIAIAHEYPVVAKYLIDAGANVNAVNSQKSYPLIEASKKGFNHIVKHLLKKGADVNQKDSLGRTAIVAAVAAKHERLVNTLLQAGANASLRDENGISAVMLAESKNYKKIYSLLTTTASSNL